MMRLLVATVLLASLGNIAPMSGTFAQAPVPSIRTTLRLLDEFGSGLGSEERSVRFDVLFSELGFYEETGTNSTSVGYVLIYCGKVCRYGEVESHIRGIELKIHTRKAPRNRLKIIAAGYREKLTVELWLASDGNAAPVPRPTINIKQVAFTKATRPIVQAYDCCDDTGFLWRSFKP